MGIPPGPAVAGLNGTPGGGGDVSLLMAIPRPSMMACKGVWGRGRLVQLIGGVLPVGLHDPCRVRKPPACFEFDWINGQCVRALIMQAQNPSWSRSNMSDS